MAEPITVACEHCQSKLKLKSAAAVGKKIACPKCKKVFTVRAPAPKSEDDLFDDLPLDDYKPPGEEEEEEAPKKSKSGKGAGAKGKKGGKRKSSSESGMGSLLLTGLLILVGIGGLGGAGYAVMKFLPGGGGLTAYLPEDIDTLIHIRVADLLAAPVAAPLVGEAKVKEAIEKGFETSGLRPSDIESVSVGLIGYVASPKPNQFGPVNREGFKRFVVVIKTRAPLDVEKLKTSLKTPVTPANHNGQEYFTATMNGQIFGYFRPNEKTLVFGPEAELKTAIDSKGASPASSRYRFIDQKQHFVAALAPKDLTLFRTYLGDVSFRVDPKTGEKTETTDNVVLGKSWGMTASSDIIFREVTRLNSSGTAKNSLEDAKTVFGEQRDQFEMMKGQVAMLSLAAPAMAAPAGRIVEHISKAFASGTVTTSGANLVTELTVPGAMVGDLKEMATAAVKMAEENAQGGAGGFPFPGMSPPGIPQAGFPPAGFPTGSANPVLPEGVTLPPDAAAAGTASAETPATPTTTPPANPAAPPP